MPDSPDPCLLLAQEGCPGRHPGEGGWPACAPLCEYERSHYRVATLLRRQDTKTRTRVLEEVKVIAQDDRLGGITRHGILEAIDAMLKASSGEERPPMVKMKRDRGPLVGG